ncbi:major facilitator superfamily domain-containing protein [Stachybotrys elegans]|uniref:Major facilitator superfamily domain-containing protein n=1 Tax=Stachybotrys elegans TaxID=80388 RepID=A0A8K0WND4_9HYPO|nr:major facilitator superfamily domain-containing protein [Stachybotrys elegans]
MPEQKNEAIRDIEDTTNKLDDDNALIVWWDSGDDPRNPYNWPAWRKWTNCGLISVMTFLSPLASSMFAPGVSQALDEFGTTGSRAVVSSLVVSVYVMGFAAGPMALAPLSEMYGRVPVYHAANVGFVAFTVGCALAPNLGGLVVLRFLCGVCGSAPITIGGGSIADMVVQEHRGSVMSGFSMGPLIGPVIGPIAGGFLTDAMGWRWVFWVLAMVVGVTGLAMLALLRESYAPVILHRMAVERRSQTGNPLFRSKLDMGLSPADFFKRGIVRPAAMLRHSPIIIITAFYLAINYGFLYLFYTTFPSVFTGQYGFSTSIVGLSYLGQGIGSIIGLVAFSLTSDKYMKKRAAAARVSAGAEPCSGSGHSGSNAMKPEYRLPYLPAGALLVPVGLFIYGWAAHYRLHWIAPIIGTAISGVGIIVVYMAITLYLIDTFTIYAASALAANTVIRSIAGALLPLAGLPMFNNLGLGWGNSLLAFIALLLVPVAFILMRYSEALREKFPTKGVV